MFAFLFITCAPASQYMQCTFIHDTHYTLLEFEYFYRNIYFTCSNLTDFENAHLRVIYGDYEEDWTKYTEDISPAIFNGSVYNAIKTRYQKNMFFSRCTIAVKPLHNLIKVEKFATIDVPMILPPDWASIDLETEKDDYGNRLAYPGSVMNLIIHGLKVSIPDQNSKLKLTCEFYKNPFSIEYEIDNLTEEMKFPIQIPENATFVDERLDISIIDSYNQKKSGYLYFEIHKGFHILKKDTLKVFVPAMNFTFPAMIIGYSNYELVTEIDSKNYECKYAEGNITCNISGVEHISYPRIQLKVNGQTMTELEAPIQSMVFPIITDIQAKEIVNIMDTDEISITSNNYHGSLKFALVKNDTNITEMPDDSIAEYFNFEYYYSNKLQPGKYKLLFQVEVDQVKSAIVSKEITLNKRENPCIRCWALFPYFLLGNAEVKAKCEIINLNDGKIYAKPYERFSESYIGGYNYPCSIDNNDILTCNFTGNTDFADYISIAIIDKSHENVLSYSSANIENWSIHDLGLVNTNQVIKQADRVNFNVTIENYKRTIFKVMAAIVEPSINQMPDNARKLRFWSESSNIFTSDFLIPYDLAAGDYKLLIKYNQNGKAYHISSSTFHVNENPFYCESQDKYWDFYGEDSSFEFKCYNYPTYSDQHVARRGDNEFEVILTDREDQIVGKSKFEVHFLKKPIISRFYVIPKTPNGVIYNDDYNQTFIVGLPGMKEDAIKSCQIKYYDWNGHQIFQDSTIPTAIDDENYQFNLTLPATDNSDISKFKLELTVVNIFDYYAVSTFEIEIMPRFYPLKCSLNDNYYHKIVIDCDCDGDCDFDPYSKSKVYYTFNDKDYYPVKLDYYDYHLLPYIEATGITSFVNEVHIAILYQTREVLNSSIIPIKICPYPRISHLVNTDAKTKFIADEEIHFIFTKEVFGKFENATIEYGFSVPGGRWLKGQWMNYQSQPKPLPGSSNYSVAVLIPDSDIFVGNNTFHLRFTDICNQKFYIESESIFTILHHYKIDEKSIELPESNAENKVYKTGESIKIVFTLSNLDEGWENNTKFGVKFGNGKMHIIDHFTPKELENQKKVSSSEEKRIELDIPITDDIDGSESGETQMQIFALDKDENIVSKPIIQTIKVYPKPKPTIQTIKVYPKPKPKPDSSEEGNKLGPGGVAGIVIGIIIIIAAVAAGAFFILKAKQAKEAEISENGEDQQDPIEDA